MDISSGYIHGRIEKTNAEPLERPLYGNIGKGKERNRLIISGLGKEYAVTVEKLEDKGVTSLKEASSFKNLVASLGLIEALKSKLLGFLSYLSPTVDRLWVPVKFYDEETHKVSIVFLNVHSLDRLVPMINDGEISFDEPKEVIHEINTCIKSLRHAKCTVEQREGIVKEHVLGLLENKGKHNDYLASLTLKDREEIAQTVFKVQGFDLAPPQEGDLLTIEVPLSGNRETFVYKRKGHIFLDLGPVQQLSSYRLLIDLQSGKISTRRFENRDQEQPNLQTLEQLLREQKLTPLDKDQIYKALKEAVHDLHFKGIAHGHLSPAFIYVTKEAETWKVHIGDNPRVADTIWQSREKIERDLKEKQRDIERLKEELREAEIKSAHALTSFGLGLRSKEEADALRDAENLLVQDLNDARDTYKKMIEQLQGTHFEKACDVDAFREFIQAKDLKDLKDLEVIYQKMAEIPSCESLEQEQ